MYTNSTSNTTCARLTRQICQGVLRTEGFVLPMLSVADSVFLNFAKKTQGTSTLCNSKREQLWV